MKKHAITFFIIIITIFFCNFSYAHKGRTDEYGGHYDHSTGTYHYHSGEYAGTGEYTSPIEEGGTLIDEENDYEDTTGLLVVNDTSDPQQDKIDSLQQQINEKNEKINQLEDDKISLEKEHSNCRSYISLLVILLVFVEPPVLIYLFNK